ncbi:hypothetical protein D9758_017173 [Tetrapyrgos nigripes]|uniref:Uncharacterized protein n=1 Tax=Tetrapyrgos nigripes TaxID=182062 RepID=A0A8H5FHH3_9AGAR|nr:hypothetical protein D9758_017173 [Tetrapyrgos nigripes]
MSSSFRLSRPGSLSLRCLSSRSSSGAVTPSQLVFRNKFRSASSSSSQHLHVYAPKWRNGDAVAQQCQHQRREQLLPLGSRLFSSRSLLQQQPPSQIPSQSYGQALLDSLPLSSRIWRRMWYRKDGTSRSKIKGLVFATLTGSILVALSALSDLFTDMEDMILLLAALLQVQTILSSEFSSVDLSDYKSTVGLFGRICKPLLVTPGYAEPDAVDRFFKGLGELEMDFEVVEVEGVEKGEGDEGGRVGSVTSVKLVKEKEKEQKKLELQETFDRERNRIQTGLHVIMRDAVIEVRELLEEAKDQPALAAQDIVKAVREALEKVVLELQVHSDEGMREWVKAMKEREDGDRSIGLSAGGKEKGGWDIIG